MKMMCALITAVTLLLLCSTPAFAARECNGTTDRIDYPSAFTTSNQDLTVYARVWFDALNPIQQGYIWVAGRSTGDPGTGFTQTSGSNGRISLFRAGSTSTMNRVSSDNSISTGVWTHILATSTASLTATNTRLYVNGTETGYAVTSNGLGEHIASGDWSLCGRPLDDLRNFDGKIAEVAVWDRVLTAGEINMLAKDFTPEFVPKGLRFYAPLIRETNSRQSAASAVDGTTVFVHPRVMMRY